VGLRVPLLCVDEVGELGGVTNKKDRGIVEHPVKVAVIRLELDGETTRVTGGVGRARLATDGGETDGRADLLAN
jgi:hypothetical protein